MTTDLVNLANFSNPIVKSRARLEKLFLIKENANQKKKNNFLIESTFFQLQRGAFSHVIFLLLY